MAYDLYHGERFSNLENGITLCTDEYIRKTFFPNFSYKGVMVDVGAGPPEFLSNSKHFRKNGWRTICVEPNPKFVEQHKKENSEIYQYACSNENKISEFTINYNNDHWYTQENDGVSFSAISLRLKNVPDHNTQETIQIEVIQLNTLLTKLNVSSVDILSIDTEGWELEVLEGFDHKKYCPRVIVLEDINRSIEYENYMRSIGYKKHIELFHNHIYEISDQS
jgi:FkbM family methyltransferase